MKKLFRNAFGMENQLDVIRIENEMDTQKFRQDCRTSSKWSLIISCVAIAIALASFIVSILK